MKPKIRYFCVACQRPKMLFETQEEADRFIAYNRCDILKGRRKAPVRSYYCEICSGWHVTSNPSKEDAKRLDVKDKALAEEVDRRVKANLESKKRPKPKADPSGEKIREKMDLADEMMTRGTLDEAEKMLAECMMDLQKAQKNVNTAQSDGHIRRKEFHEKLTKKLKRLRELQTKSPEECDAFLSKTGKSNEDVDVSRAYISISAVGRIESLLKEMEATITSKEFSEVKDLAIECQKQISSIRGRGSKPIRKLWNLKLHQTINRVKRARKALEAEKRAAEPVKKHVGESNNVLDALFGMLGSPEREAFRREALEYAENMDLQVAEESEE